MNSYRPGGWGKHLIYAVLLVIGIAVTAHVVYELLLPLLPVALALLILGAVYLAAAHLWKH